MKEPVSDGHIRVKRTTGKIEFLRGAIMSLRSRVTSNRNKH